MFGGDDGVGWVNCEGNGSGADSGPNAAECSLDVGGGWHDREDDVRRKDKEEEAWQKLRS